MSDEKKVPISFDKNEEITAVFPLEDLVKEYNHINLTKPYSDRFLPLSHLPLEKNQTMVCAMTPKEAETMRISAYQPDDITILKKVFHDQFMTPSGFIGNIPNLAAGVTVIDMVREVGLSGKVTYKTVGDKTYVILKGYAGNRVNLKGTRYLNTHPEIVRFNMAKVSVTDLLKSGFKSSIILYGGIKAVEGVNLSLFGDGVNSNYFSAIGVDIPKLTITSMVSAAAGGAVVAIGMPVAAGAAVVLGVGILTGIGLDYVDQKLGITEKVSEAADTLWNNLKKALNSPSQPSLFPGFGLLDGGPFPNKTLLLGMNDNYLYA